MKESKLTVEQFVLMAIEKLAKPGHYAIHTVYSGMNEAFREYFPGLDPVEEVKKLAADNKISHRLARGGALIAKPGVIGQSTTSKEALKKMGLEK